MVKLLAFLKLIRIQIVLLIVIMQWCIRLFVIGPMIAINGFDFQVSDKLFALLSLATALIAAGGYAINNYFDLKIDQINKPKTIILDRQLNRRVAMLAHMILSGAGLVIAAYASWKLGVWKITSIYLFVVFALWFYSTQLKHQFLWGNLMVAVLAGSIPLVVGLYEIPLQNAAHPEIIEQLGYSIFNIPAYWIIGYSVAIMILTLAREITKDVIDMKGDREYGGNTIPIKLGVVKTKSVVIGVYALFGAICTWAYFEFLHVHFGMLTLFAGLCMMIVLQIILLVRAKTRKHFSYLADLNNLIVVVILISTYLLKISIESHFS